jgi:hypothetical protein
MRRIFILAVSMAIAMTCAAESENKNESENKTVASELVEKDVATAVLDDIDPVLTSHFYYFNEEEQIFLVECGQKFFRVRNIEDGKLVATLSVYLHKENGTWVDGANNVIYNPADGRFYPAKREFRKGNLVYRGAKLYQATSLRRIREVEDGLGLVL